MNYHPQYMNPFSKVDSSTSTLCFIEIPVFNANRVDTDQISQFDLGRHHLPITLLGVF